MVGEVVLEGFFGVVFMVKFLDFVFLKEVVWDVFMILFNFFCMNKVIFIILLVGSLLFLFLFWVVLMSLCEVSFGILDFCEDYDYILLNSFICWFFLLIFIVYLNLWEILLVYFMDSVFVVWNNVVDFFLCFCNLWVVLFFGIEGYVLYCIYLLFGYISL